MSCSATLRFIAFFVLISCALSAQVQTPASSGEALTYGKHANLPVNQYTGTGNIQVPIHTVTDGPLALPIALNYHTGGLQVNVPSSSVGWGWNLNVGGMVSRVIMDKPDNEDKHGYYFQGSQVRYPRNSDDLVYEVDTQPDIFTFTANGMTGRFFIDAYREPQLLTPSDVEVEIKLESGSNDYRIAQVIITDPNGVKYLYGMSDETSGSPRRAYDYTRVVDREAASIQEVEFYERTGFYLMAIVSTDGKHRIDLHYKEQYYKYKTHKPCPEDFKFRRNSGRIDDDEDICANRQQTTYYVQSCIPTKIDANNTDSQVLFQTTSRYDLSRFFAKQLPERVNSIIVNTGGLPSIQYSLLNSSYFADHVTRSGNARTKLDGIRKTKYVGSDGTEALEWKFDYLGTKNSSGRIMVPGIESHDIDHWGYYNYKSTVGRNDPNKDLTPKGTGLVVGGQRTDYGLANRESHKPAMMQGMLYRVTYPTGGHLQLDYEANTYQIESPDDIHYRKSTSTIPGEAGQESQTFDFTYTSQIANSVDPKWELCVRAYSGLGGGESTFPTPIEESDGTVDSEGEPNGDGYVEVRTTGGTLVALFGFNSRSTNETCRPYPLSTSWFKPMSVGTRYKVTITASNARVELKLSARAKPTAAVCGGLRIKSTTLHDGLSFGRNIVTKYRYEDKDFAGATSGILFYKPKYAYRINDRTGVFTSLSQAPLYGTDGLHVGYKRVVVEQNGRGETEYNFHAEKPLSDTRSYPVPPPSAQDLQNGLLESSTSYNETGDVVHSTSTVYTRTHYKTFGGSSSTGYFFTKRKDVPYYTSGSLRRRNLYTRYYLRVGLYRPRTVTTTLDGVTTTTTYNYHNSNLLPRSVTIKNSNGDEYRQETEYVVDEGYHYTAIRDSARSRNLVHLVAHTLSYHNGEAIDGSYNTYRFYRTYGTSPSTSASGRLSVPRVYRKKRYVRTYDDQGQLKNDGKWQTLAYITKYNSFGQIRESYEVGWNRVTIDYNGILSKTKTVDGRQTRYIYNPNYPKSNLLSRIEYPDGTSTSYTYDAFGRLETITDNCQNIVTTNTYVFRHNGKNLNYVEVETTYPPADSRSKLTRSVTREYLDGLGRKIQTVARNAGTSQSKDVLSSIIYNNSGQVEKVYKPVERTNNNGAYQSLPGTLYTEYKYEDSPLGRQVHPAGEPLHFVGCGANIKHRLDYAAFEELVFVLQRHQFVLHILANFRD